jgi:hypothetical protein
VREVHTDHPPTRAEHFSGFGYGRRGVRDVVQDTREENSIEGPVTGDPSRELGDFVWKAPSPFREGVRFSGALGEGDGLLVDVHAGDIVAVAGEL